MHKMEGLDKIDYKLLYALLNNSKISFTKLGRAARISRENAAYRLSRFVKSGLVKSFNAVIDVDSLGFKQYAVFIQLAKVDKNKEAEILGILKNNQNISWIGVLAGKWSLTFDFYAKNQVELSQNLNELLRSFGSNVGEYVLLNLTDKEYFLNKSFNEKPIFAQVKHSKSLKFDNTDLKLLKLVNANSRITYSELSKNLNLTANAIKKRTKQLESKGIIQGYTLCVDPKKMSFEWYGIQLKLLKFDEKSIKDLIKFFREHPKIIFYYKYIGGAWDFDLGILVKNSNELREFINELRTKFIETIKLNDLFLILEEITNNTLPPAIFK